MFSYLTDGTDLYEVYAEYTVPNHGRADGTLPVTLVRVVNPPKWEPQVVACGKGARGCTRAPRTTDWHRMGWGHRSRCREVVAA